MCLTDVINNNKHSTDVERTNQVVRRGAGTKKKEKRKERGMDRMSRKAQTCWKTGKFGMCDRLDTESETRSLSLSYKAEPISTYGGVL